MNAKEPIFADQGRGHFRRVKATTREELILSCLPMARLFASGFKGADYDDAFQQASLGLISAAKTFDVRKGSFANHAFVHLIGAKSRFVIKRRQEQSEPFEGIQFKVSSYTGKKVRFRFFTVSGALPYKNGEEDFTVEDSLVSDQPSQEEQLIQQESYKIIREVLNQIAHETFDNYDQVFVLGELNESKNEIITRHLLADDPVSTRDLAAELGVSRQGVQGVIKNIIKRARILLRRKGIK